MSENLLPEENSQDAEIAIQIEDSVEAQTNNDDELERYTKSVSKRINKLNEKHRATEHKPCFIKIKRFND